MIKKRKNIHNLDEIADRIRQQLTEKDAAREICLKTCREIIRLSSTSIRATHRQDKEEALKLIDSASTLVNQIKRDFKQKHNDLLSANYIHDSFKEYAEASISYSIIFNRVIPDPDKLGVAYPAYLNGLAESVGELRRYVLDGLRTGQYAAAEDLLEIMDHIYSILVTMDFPDAITYGLRRNTDSTRGIIEKTRSELTLIQHNNVLQQKINILSSKLSNSTDPV
jgi:translin